MDGGIPSNGILKGTRGISLSPCGSWVWYLETQELIKVHMEKGREAVRVRDVPPHLYTDFYHAPPSWSGLALEGSLGSNYPKELSCHHQGLYSFADIAQKKEKSKPNPQPSPHPPSTPRQHLASEKILKPYIFLLCSVTTLSFSLERKCSWEDIWRCLFFSLPWVCLWRLQTCGSGCPVLAWSPQLHHCQMLVRGFRSILPIPSFSEMPPVLF